MEGPSSMQDTTSLISSLVLQIPFMGLHRFSTDILSILSKYCFQPIPTVI